MLLTHLVLLAQQPPDETAVNDAILAIARLLASFLEGGAAIALIFLGYEYMFTESASRGAHLKKGLLVIILGALLIGMALTLAPVLGGVSRPQ